MPYGKINLIFIKKNNIMGNKTNIKNKKITQKHNNKTKKNNEDFNNTNNVKILIQDSFYQFWLDNTFCVFKSFNNILFLIYTNKRNSIISYNLIDYKIINEIKNAHQHSISNFRHFFDKNNKRDLIMTISGVNNNIKIWNFNTFECLLNIRPINNKGWIDSACFFYKDNNTYIITSNNNITNPLDPIKIFDFKGNNIKELNDSLEFTYFIDIYEDNIKNKSYLITGNKGYSKSYDYNDNKVYHKYVVKNDIPFHHVSILIDNSEEITKMIEPSCFGINVWNFHSGDLIRTIKINDEWLHSIGTIEKNILYGACRNRTIAIIDVNKGEIINYYFEIHNKTIINIKKINHPKYGDCLISSDSSCIKLMIIKDK